MEPVVTLSALMLVGKIVGSGSALFGTLFGVFKVINWVKTKFTNIDQNVTTLKSTMESGFSNLSNDIKDQTKTIAQELREQRQDFRTFYGPVMMQQAIQQSIQALPAPARAKRSPVKRKKISKKA